MTMMAADGVVVKPVADMHSGPREDSDVVSQAVFGSPLRLLEEKGGWANVRTDDDYRGWMKREDLYPLPPGAKPYAASGRMARVTSLFANLYREPDVTKHKPLLTVPFEARLEVASESENGENRWVEVRLPDGTRAWVQDGDVSLAFEPLGIPESVTLARRFLGLPYLWGGTSTFGFDCSGFTQMLIRRRGRIMPRDAAPQSLWDGSMPVDRSALQPGDLLYFGGSADKITHTGMYVGNGEFIHATTNGAPVVQISRLDDEPWTGLLKLCRRLR